MTLAMPIPLDESALSKQKIIVTQCVCCVCMCVFIHEQGWLPGTRQKIASCSEGLAQNGSSREYLLCFCDEVGDLLIQSSLNLV